MKRSKGEKAIMKRDYAIEFIGWALYVSILVNVFKDFV